MRPIIINFTPTGMLPQKEDTPSVPITPQEIIEEVHEAYELGITLTHLHAREADGTPSYKQIHYAKIMEGIRKHCPDLVLCFSLSGRNFPEFEKRSEALELYPDMGSLTLGSLNFSKQASNTSPDMLWKLTDKMKEYGVKPELEVFDTGMLNYAHYLIKKNQISGPYYFNIILGNIATAQMDLAQAGLLLHQLPENSYWAFGGIGQFQLQANLTAMANGGGVRVGLEDNTIYDYQNGSPATNKDLLKRIHKMALVIGREIMPPASFGQLGFYNQKVQQYA